MRLFLFLAALVASLPAFAQLQAPKPAEHAAPQTKFPYKDEVYVANNFHFGDGGSLPELHLHYLTLGKPHRNAAGHVDNAVLLLHGTGGNRQNTVCARRCFRPELFGPGQPLDVTKYFLIFPDDIGQGESSQAV